ncbi:Uncharacterised protein [Serratia ficaria]|uniref:hypothetical protein n=1 Tax=Serratia ficaria TaxID=61651 RepID=UPI0021C4F2A1|nr:hypothetical protein [Serratia ficaria]CAI2786448.1 Uncharacterised protein [Serratia ficaria]
MDNKLSELSKPVAWVRYPTANAEYVVTGNVHIARIWRRYHGDAVQPVYSQEYVSALLQRIDELEVAEIKPEGLKLMIEAIGAHGYIVGCLVQGRPDLALEESRKWANAFSQAAEQSNG